MGRLILIFILVPLADLLLLMWLANFIGFWPSVGMVIVSGIVGAYLARRSYRAVGTKIRASLTQGRMSPELLSDGAMIFLAAGLLLTPGFLTDAAGLSLLIPQCRRRYQRWIVGWFKRNFKVQVVSGGNPFGGPSMGNGETVDGRVVEPRENASDPTGPELLESGENSP